MHPTSQTILNIINATPGYEVENLIADLQATDDELITRRQAAGIFKVSLRTVDNWLKQFPEISGVFGNSSRRIYKNKLMQRIKQ